MASDQKEALEKRLKAALWFSIGKIVDEETLKLGVNVTPQFIGSLTEMVWAQIRTGLHSKSTFGAWTEAKMFAESVSQDLESFSKHAGRTMISTDDVMLLCRRNEGLETLLKDFLAATSPTKSKASSRP